MDEKMKNGMEIVEIDGQPVQPEEPETPEKDEEVTEEKKSFFKTVGHVVTAPARWVGRMLKKSPGSAAVGAVIGGGAALGGKMLYDHFIKGRMDPGEGDETVDEDDVPSNIVEFNGPTDEDEAM